MKKQIEMTGLEKSLFKYLRDTLKQASIEKIVNYYVTHLIMTNAMFFKGITKKYNLPNDILETHKIICKLAE